MFPEPTWLGRIPYLDALERQRRTRDGVVDGTGGEAFFLLEHDPVVTTGLRPVDDVDEEKVGVPVVRTERGGLATWHGPGQLVGYPILAVARRGGSVKGTIAGVEQGVIDWLVGRGVDASRVAGRPGVWVGGAKICAVGMHFRRGVCMHGFALNLTADLGTFRRFVPCGIADAEVTSLGQVCGSSPEPHEVWREVATSVSTALVDTFRVSG
ncbi:MAG: lipoyl(octanoyl) transferase LipB [Alphaproteobacteria bacterium]|nr:lipoyl(octanoyl) transferase LipB [Alphaproteobacteria bacterium]